MASVIDLATYRYNIELDSSGFERNMQNAEGNVGKLKGKFDGLTKFLKTTVVGGFVALGTAIAGTAVKGVKDFIGFEKQMNEVFTLLPNISKDAMSDMTEQVKDFSEEFGTLPNEVVPALYQSISAGVPKDNVFEFLETAQKAAVGGVTKLETAVDGISSVVNAYGSDVIGASKASDLMFTAVKLGKTNFEELSNSLFNVIPTASSLGVEFGNVTAALASMTAQGTPTSVATTQLRQMLVELSKEGSKTSETFKEISGEDFKSFIAEGHNIQDVLELMSEHAKESNLGINDLFSSVEAGNAALALTGKGAESFSNALGEMANSTGATNTAFDTMEQGLGRSFDKIKASMATLLLDVGENLAPTVADFANWITENIPQIKDMVENTLNGVGTAISTISDVIMPIFQEGFRILIEEIIPAFKEAFDEQSDTVLPKLINIFNVLKDEVLPVFISTFQSIGDTIIPIVSDAFKYISENILPVIIEIFEFIYTEIVPSLAESFQEWVPKIMEIMQGLWEIIKIILDSFMEKVDFVLPYIETVFTYIFESISNVITVFLDILSGLIDFILGVMTGDWERAWEGVKKIFVGIWEGIKESIENSIEFIRNLVDNVIGSIGKAIDKINIFNNKKVDDKTVSVDTSISDVPSLDVGTPFVPQDQLSYIHRGEAVIPAEFNPFNPNSKSSLGTTNNISVSVSLDGANFKDRNDIDYLTQQLNRKFKQSMREVGIRG